MSWIRRLLVLLAFALMIGGVALMLIQEEELFLAVSVAGFLLVLAAVPKLPREEAGEADAYAVALPDAAQEPDLAGRPPSGTVTVLPQQPPGRSARAAREPRGPEPRGPEPPQSAPPEPAAKGPEPREPEPQEPQPRPRGPQESKPARSEPPEGDPNLAPPSSEPPPPARPGVRMSEAAHTVEACGGPSPAEVSFRRVAAAGAAAGALVWIWRRLRR